MNTNGIRLNSAKSKPHIALRKVQIEVSGNFIMQNPVRIKKSIEGKSEDKGYALGEISGYTEKYCIEFMTKKLDNLPKGSSVFFIGRYSFDSKLLSDSSSLECQYNNISGLDNVK